MITLLTVSQFVPYDYSIWSKFFSAAMTTIGSAAQIGLPIFGAILFIGLLNKIIGWFF